MQKLSPRIPPPKSLFPLCRARLSIALHGSHVHSIPQVHLARQGDAFVGLQSRKHLVIRRAGDSHRNIAPCNPVVLHHEYIVLPLVVTHCRARHHQHSPSLAHHDAHLHVYVWQELQLVVVHRTQHFSHAPRSQRDYLLRNLFRVPSPRASRFRVPIHLHFLARLEPSQVRLVHKCAHSHVTQVCHLRQHISNFHIISRAHRQGIKRPVGRRNHCRRTHLLFERFPFFAGLLGAKRSLLRAHRSSLHQLISFLRERLKITACLR